jgi:hypothetical protein
MFCVMQNGRMPMKTNCMEYESRRYPNGDTVQKCNLDLAPEAPWRCPTDCPKFRRRGNDAGWIYGSLGAPKHVTEPASLGDGSAAAVLDEAEDIINAVGASVLADIERERAAQRGPKWKFWRRS